MLKKSVFSLSSHLEFSTIFFFKKSHIAFLKTLHFTRDYVDVNQYKFHKGGANILFGDGHVAPAGNAKNLKFNTFF